MDRLAEAIDVEAVKGDFGAVGQRFIVAAQPVGKGQHFRIAPHPGRETDKRFAPARAFGVVADIAVDPRRIGPVSLDRDDGKAMMLDQPARDRRTRGVEFGGAMRRLAQQHDLRVAEAVEKFAERLPAVRAVAIFRHDFSAPQ